MSAVVSTSTARCHRCYSCVRRCPAKAIRVQAGQAEVVEARCLACGRCLHVCPRGAKAVSGGLPRVRQLLARGPTVLMLAPSFAAAYSCPPGQIVSAARRAGFAAVCEVAFGAELVASAMNRAYQAAPQRLTITSACPAAVDFIRKYAPALIPYLAPVHSPMTALGKALKTRLRPGCATVFAGPCTAKIKEARDPEVSPWVDAVMSFRELDALFCDRDIDPRALPGEDFDPPRSGLGAGFPLPGGLLRTAKLPSDPFANRIHSAVGVDSFIEVIERLEHRVNNDDLDDIEARFFDVLFCQGCIAGPLLDGDESLLVRKERLLRYLRTRPTLPPGETEGALRALADLDLERRFAADDQRAPAPGEHEIAAILARTGKVRREDELNCRACGYRSCREKAVAVHNGLAEPDMCLPYLIERLEGMVSSLNQSQAKLTEAQTQLVRSERLASMGQLAAGIAHELNNPLGTILIYAHLLTDQIGDSTGPRADAETILREANRCKTIVAGLLDFARQNELRRSRVDLDELVRTAVDSMRMQAEAAGTACTFVADLPGDLPAAQVDRDQVLQMLLNLIRNAVDVIPAGGTITVGARWAPERNDFVLHVSDTGPGIPAEHLGKLFSPFFTTKPVGRGTGLGLPICYGIVKMHRGSITARNNTPDPGATFEVRLPAPGDGSADPA